MIDLFLEYRLWYSFNTLFSRKSAKEKINCLIFDWKKTLNEQSSTLRTDKERKGFLKKITDLTKFGDIISNLEPQISIEVQYPISFLKVNFICQWLNFGKFQNFSEA